MRLHNGFACALILWCGRSRVLGTPWGRDLAAGLALILLCAAAHLVNDLLDLGADRANRPGRVLPSGRLTPGELRKAAAATWAAGLALGLAVAPLWAPWWIFWAVAGPGYSLVAKGRGWVAPWWTAAVIASCWIAATGEESPGSVEFLAAGGILLFLVFRELVKSLEDARGDLLAGYRTLAGGFPGSPKGVACLGTALIPLGAWLAWNGSGLPGRLAAGIFLGSLLGGVWALWKPHRLAPHLAGALLKVGGFAGVTLLWTGLPR